MSSLTTRPIELPTSGRRNDAQIYAVEYRLDDSRDGYQAVLEGLAMRYVCV